MDCSNTTELFSFSPDSSKSILFVKLSEDALLRLEEYERKTFNGLKPTIQFKDDKGVITIPEENGKVAYDFSLSLMDANRSQGSFQCMEKSDKGELTSLGKIETKMQLHAKDTSIEHTKSKIEAVDKKQKTYGAKEIKTATASQTTSSQGYLSQERLPVPRRRKPVPLLKKFLNRNLQRQINEGLSSVKPVVPVSTSNPTNRTAVLPQPPVPKLSKEIVKKHILEASCDEYSGPRLKKQRISHCSQKESADGVSSPTIHKTNGAKSEGATSKCVNNLQAVFNNKNEQDNQKLNHIEQPLNKSSQKLKNKEIDKVFLNGSMSNGTDPPTSIPVNKKTDYVRKKKLENKKKRRKQKRKAARKAARLGAKRATASQAPSLPMLRTEQTENTLTITIATEDNCKSLIPLSAKLRNEQTENTLATTIATEDNCKSLIPLSKEIVAPLINNEKQEIETKNPAQPQSSLKTKKSRVASLLIDEFLSQTPDFLEYENEGTKRSPIKSSDTTDASKYDVLADLGFISRKCIEMETELTIPPEAQLCVSDGCEVTSTTEKRINETPGSIADSVYIKSDPVEISEFGSILNYKEIESFQQREAYLEVYEAKLEQYNKLNADLKVSCQYMYSLMNTMKIHLTDPSVFHELLAKCKEASVHQENRVVFKRSLSIELIHLSHLLRIFDSKLRDTLIET